MGLREAGEVFMDALVENAKQSFELAETIGDFLGELEEEDACSEGDDFAENDPAVQEQPAERKTREWLTEDESMDFWEKAVETLETLVAAMGGKIVPADDTEE